MSKFPVAPMTKVTQMEEDRPRWVLKKHEKQDNARPCLDAPQKLEFFHSLSIISIFGSIHEVVNIGKKNN
jgi:hypothetical protein